MGGNLAQEGSPHFGVREFDVTDEKIVRRKGMGGWIGDGSALEFSASRPLL